MDWLNQLLLEATSNLKPYSYQLSVAMVATLLVIYGNTINRTLRALVKPYPFVIRVSAFILLCTFGYGLLSVWGATQLRLVMSSLPNLYFAPTIVALFILLGVLAERFHKN